MAINPYFNAEYYLHNNNDLIANGINTAEGAWAHYLNYGAAEALNGLSSRAPAPWFDVQYYLTANKDLLTSGLTPAQLFEHFVTYGINEGRVPSATAAQMTDASLLAYAKGNDDLAKAFGVAADATSLTDAQRDGLANHFYEYGYKEGRADAPFTPDTNPGQTFTLTTGIDVFNVANGKATNGNDTFIADNGTSQSADQIDGGSGSDTFKLYTTGAVTLPSLKNVENIWVQGGAASVDTSSLTDVTSLELNKFDLSASGYNVNVADGTKLTVSDTTGTANAITLTNTSATEQSLVVSKAGASAAADVDFDLGAGSKVATLNIDATDKSFISVADTAGSLKTVNITGAADLTVRDVAGATTITIDNSAKTTVGTAVAKVAITGGDGAETININHAAGAAREFSVKTGAGDDKINLVNLTAATDLADGKVTISGGDGTDTLAMTSALGASLSALSAAAYTKKGIANDFEILEITNQASAGDAVGLAQIGSNITTVKYAAGLGNAGQTLTGLASDGTVALGAAAAAGANKLTVSVKDADAAGHNADVLNITLNAAHAGGSLDYGILDAANVETINIDSTSTKTTALVAADKNEIDLTIANAVHVKITGNVYADLDGAAWAGSALSSVDASGNTAGVAVSVAGASQGILITGTDKADLIIGGDGADKIIAGAGDDVITGGKGNDIIDISGGGSNTINFESTAANNGKDTITGFNTGALASGGDVLKITDFSGGSAGVISANLTNLTGNQALANNSLYTVNYNAAISAKDFGGADFADMFAAAGKVFSTTVGTAGDHGVVVIQGTDVTQIYYVDSGSNTTISAGEVVLVGVLDGITNVDTFIGANFA